MSEEGVAYISIIPQSRGASGEIAKQIDGQSVGQSVGRQVGSGITRTVGRAVKGIASVGIGAAAAVAGVALSKGFSRALNIQDAQAKLTGLGHSASSVTSIMNNALASVKGTAFGLDSAATVAAGAVAAGIKPGQQLEKVLKLTADAATIAGTDMGSMGAIFNKVAASGKLQGDVIAQLQDAGVPVLQFVAKQIGKTAAETSKLASKGKIDFATFQAAMQAGLGGAALASGDTARGSFANVGAALSRLGAQFASPLVKSAPTLFTSIGNAIDRLGVTLTPVAARFGDFANKQIPLLAKRIDAIDFDAVVARISAFVVKAKAGFSELMATFQGGGKGQGLDTSKIFGNLGSIGNIITPLMPIFVSLGQAIGSISGSIGELIGSGVQLLPPIITLLSQALQFLADHSELVGPLIVGIAAAMVVFRTAQAAANVAELGALPIRAANVVAILAQANANRALATQMAIANGQQVASRAAMLPATAQVLLNTGALVASRVAMVAGAVATGVATAAQWLFNAALTANPIGIVIVAVAALVAALIFFFTKTKTGQKIWSAFSAALVVAFNAAKAGVVAAVQFLGAQVTSRINMVRSVISLFIAVGRQMASSFTSAVGSVVRLFTGLKAKVTGAIGNAASWLLDVGRNIVAGLKNGISGAWSSVTSLVSGLTDSLPAIVKKALGIHSPSRVFLQLGRFVTQGFAKGILGGASQVRSAMQALANKTIDAYNSTAIERKLLKAATATTAAVYSKNGTTIRAISAGQRDFINSIIGANTSYMVKLANQSDTVAKRLKTANKNLQTLLKQAASYKASVLSSLSSSDPTQEVNAAGYVKTLTDQVAQTKTLTTVLAKLKKAGLDSTTYQSLVSKGLDSLPIAQSILASGKSGIKSIGSLQSQLTSSSKSLAQQATSDMYGAGVAAAKGIVAGLKSRQSELSKTMRDLAKTMVSAIKAELDIHSPSRVMDKLIGQNVGAGVTNGIVRSTSGVEKAMANLVAIPSMDKYTSKIAVATNGYDRVSVPSLSRTVDAVAPAATAGSYSQTNHFYNRDEDPQLLARKVGREFAKQIVGMPA